MEEELGAASVVPAGSESLHGGLGRLAEVRGWPGAAVVGVGRCSREPGGCGFLWEGPGAAVPASEEGCPGSRPGGVGAPRTLHRGCSEVGAEAARGAAQNCKSFRKGHGA